MQLEGEMAAKVKKTTDEGELGEFNGGRQGRVIALCQQVPRQRSAQ